MTPRYPTVLFDADNTLFDFDEAEAQALTWLMDHLGLPETEKDHYLAINRAMWRQRDLGNLDAEFLTVERFRVFLNETGLTGDPEELNRAYLQKLGECPALLPGAEELCRTLARSCTLAIVTNGMAAVQKSRMRDSAISAHISHLFISQEMGCWKPERQFYERVFQGLGLGEADKPGVLMVGDNLLTDVKGALDFGLDAVWFAPDGASPSEEITPTFVARDFQAVQDIALYGRV